MHIVLSRRTRESRAVLHITHTHTVGFVSHLRLRKIESNRQFIADDISKRGFIADCYTFVRHNEPPLVKRHDQKAISSGPPDSGSICSVTDCRSHNIRHRLRHTHSHIIYIVKPSPIGVMLI